MGKSYLKELGLNKEEPDRDDIIRWMKRTKTIPYWNKDHGLIFKPHVGGRTRERFQEILQVHTKEDVERLRSELKSREDVCL